MSPHPESAVRLPRSWAPHPPCRSVPTDDRREFPATVNLFKIQSYVVATTHIFPGHPGVFARGCDDLSPCVLEPADHDAVLRKTVIRTLIDQIKRQHGDDARRRLRLSVDFDALSGDDHV